jgi:hypothetical protein
LPSYRGYNWIFESFLQKQSHGQDLSKATSFFKFRCPNIGAIYPEKLQPEQHYMEFETILYPFSDL